MPCCLPRHRPPASKFVERTKIIAPSGSPAGAAISSYNSPAFSINTYLSQIHKASGSMRNCERYSVAKVLHLPPTAIGTKDNIFSTGLWIDTSHTLDFLCACQCSWDSTTKLGLEAPTQPVSKGSRQRCFAQDGWVGNRNSCASTFPSNRCFWKDAAGIISQMRED